MLSVSVCVRERVLHATEPGVFCTLLLTSVAVYSSLTLSGATYREREIKEIQLQRT